MELFWGVKRIKITSKTFLRHYLTKIKISIVIYINNIIFKAALEKQEIPLSFSSRSKETNKLQVY